MAVPIVLNAAQEKAVKEWAADDRLWTTQETVEFNLSTFARVILQVKSPNPVYAADALLFIADNNSLIAPVEKITK